MKQISDIADLRQLLGEWVVKGRTIGFVPTMGALHEGHLSLIREAAAHCDRVVVSIFVNPLQFGPNEDYLKYPRPLEQDAERAQSAGTDLLFVPEVGDLTPADQLITVDPGEMGNVLCGRYRPGHFRGVCTIVLKLLNLIQPKIAFFGWKDAQQLIILRKMATDLNLEVDLKGVETVRESSGLALSSRNLYLSETEKEQASVLSRILLAVRDQFVEKGTLTVQELSDVAQALMEQAPLMKLQYLEMRDVVNLTPLEQATPGRTLIALAAFAGNTRLIDNIRF